MPDPPKVPESAYRILARLGALWGIEPLEKHLTLEISSRMTRSLGIYHPTGSTIRLNGTLLDPRNAGIFREVLCHEAAHAAVYLNYGARCKPHGPEWKSLMVIAYGRARIKIPVKDICGRQRTAPRRRYSYVLQCRDCGRIFRSRKMDRRWRCKSCLDQGLNGQLELVRRRQV